MSPLLLLVILAVVGLLVYVLAANPKASEIGRLMFACAFLALCLDVAHVLAVLR